MNKGHFGLRTRFTTKKKKDKGHAMIELQIEDNQMPYYNDSRLEFSWEDLHPYDLSK